MTEEVKTEISVTIEGEKFTGWKNPSVSTTIHSLAGSFSMDAVDYPEGATDTIVVGASCIVKLSTPRRDHTLITGYVDKTSIEESGDSSGFEFNGRSKTADLLDCSAIYKTNTWKNVNLMKICEDICNPFGIPVFDYALALGTPVKEFGIQTGETGFNAIERLCRAYSILPMSTIGGGLELTNIAETQADVGLEVGKNIKRIRIEEDASGRYSDYYFKGQARGNGGSWLKNDVTLTGECRDLDVGRHRPLLFVAERHMDATEIQNRAAWEAQVRAGRASRALVDVQGWLQDPRDENSRPWAINELVTLKWARRNIDADLVVASVTFLNSSSAGRITKLELSPPEIFAASPGEEIQLSRRSRVRPS